MIFKKANFEDVLASGMDEIMQSETHQNIFAKSDKVASEQPKDLKAVFNDLLKASEILDQLGFNKSASSVLKIADDLLESLEVTPEEEMSLDSPVASLEVEEELAELEELKNLLDEKV